MSAQVRPEGSTDGWRRARGFDRPLRSRARHTLLEEPPQRSVLMPCR